LNYILGIDAAWTNKEPSGVVLIKANSFQDIKIINAGRSYEEFLKQDIDWNTKIHGSEPNMRELINLCDNLGCDVNCIALDIPLSPRNILERRVCDSEISKLYGSKGASTHSPNPERPGKISELIFQQLTDIGFDWAYEEKDNISKSFIEVYPHTAIIEYLNLDYRLAYKVSKKNKYWKDINPKLRTEKLITNLNILVLLINLTAE